jgi:hypothetical protein
MRCPATYSNSGCVGCGQCEIDKERDEHEDEYSDEYDCLEEENADND